MKKFSWPLVIILIVCVLGLYRDITSASFMNLIIPLLLIVGIILLIKFPPNTWKKKTVNKVNHDSAKYKEAVKIQKQRLKEKQHSQSSVKKVLPFKVIDGGKDDPDSPRYH